MFNKIRLLTPGPTPLPESVRLAMAQDMIHHRKSAFTTIARELQAPLRTLFGTEQPVLPLTCSGTGAMTAAVHNLFRAGQRVLVVEGGKFGQRWSQIARDRGLEVTRLDVPWGEAVRPEAVAQALEARADVAGVLVQLSETSTGVLHPVQEIAALTRDREVLLVVDGISAVGLSPCPMDAWGVDCLLTGSQKGLMTPPGLALLALSSRAWVVAERTSSDCFYFNLPKERDNCLKGQTLFTPAVSLLLGLKASMDMLMDTGLDNVYRKQWALTQMTRHGVSAMGLELFAKSHYAWGLTSILLPAGLDGSKVLEICARDYGVHLAGGQDHLKGRIVRLGHMGWVDWSDVVAGLYALVMGIRAVGGFVSARDYLETALNAWEQALRGQAGVPVAGARS